MRPVAARSIKALTLKRFKRIAVDDFRYVIAQTDSSNGRLSAITTANYHRYQSHDQNDDRCHCERYLPSSLMRLSGPGSNTRPEAATPSGFTTGARVFLG